MLGKDNVIWNVECGNQAGREADRQAGRRMQRKAGSHMLKIRHAV
jgi:hypothetical protein